MVGLLEMFQFGEWQLIVVDVYGVEFGVVMQGGYVFVGIEQFGWVECCFYGVEQGQFVGIELSVYLVDFFVVDVMFVGDVVVYCYV